MRRGYIWVLVFGILIVSVSAMGQPAAVYFYYWNDEVPPEEPPLGCPCMDGTPYPPGGALICIYDDFMADGPGPCDVVLDSWFDAEMGPGYFAQSTALIIDDASSGMPLYVEIQSGGCWWTTSTYVVYPGAVEIFIAGDDWHCENDSRPIFECWFFPPWSVQASDDALCMQVELAWEHYGYQALGFNIYCDEELVATCGPDTRDTILQVTSSIPRLYAMTSIFDFGESWLSNSDFGSATRLNFAEGPSGDIQGEHLAGSEFTVAFDLPMATPEECPTTATLILLSNDIPVDTLCVDSLVSETSCHFPNDIGGTLTNCRLLLAAMPLSGSEDFGNTDTTESEFTLIPLTAGKRTAIPAQFGITAVYPNPFNTETQIEFTVPRDALISVEIYNTVGQHVATLADEQYSAGVHTVTWDARSMSSGVYLYRLTGANTSQTAKLLLLR